MISLVSNERTFRILRCLIKRENIMLYYERVFDKNIGVSLPNADEKRENTIFGALIGHVNVGNWFIRKCFSCEMNLFELEKLKDASTHHILRWRLKTKATVIF